jgi:hypothetical protein
MARRRRPEGVRFADMPAHLRRFVPEPWLDPRYYAAARVAWCRAHGLSVVDVRLAERAERLRLVGFDDPVRSFPADGEPEGDGDD